MQDGRLEISNNRSERAIKLVVIGRKSFCSAIHPVGPVPVLSSTVLWRQPKKTG